MTALISSLQRFFGASAASTGGPREPADGVSGEPSCDAERVQGAVLDGLTGPLDWIGWASIGMDHIYPDDAGKGRRR